MYAGINRFDFGTIGTKPSELQYCVLIEEKVQEMVKDIVIKWSTSPDHFCIYNKVYSHFDKFGNLKTQVNWKVEDKIAGEDFSYYLKKRIWGIRWYLAHIFA
ncbi:hypothetical protein LCGC14_2863100 [marine sediment metagenome]|uniref:Uncharacterized protein n=1 Tax=marine sediment metagenome TaxID=412755 RepID=A0A0F8Y5D4_9ZZZZ